MRGQQLLCIALLIALSQSELITIPLSRRNRNIADKNTINNGTKSRFLENDATYSIDTLTNNNQMVYYGDIQVGKSKKTYSVVFDTGSNTLWLPSQQCVQQKNCDGLSNYYSCSAADGCTPTGKTQEIPYGKGYVSGTISSSQVSVCDFGVIPQSILLVDQALDMANLNADGLFGLGVYDQTNPNANSFVSNLFSQGLIKNMMFSFYLGYGKKDSQLVFGGFNPDKVANLTQIYYHQVTISGIKDDSQRWSINTQSMEMGSFSFQFQNGKNTAIVDSGTSLITLSDAAYYPLMNYLIENYNMKKNLSFSCSASLPDLKFTLKDTQGFDRVYSIPQDFYIIKQSGYCFLGIQNLNAADVQIILGDIFMRRYLSIFTYSNSTMGLTQSVADPDDDYTNGLQTWVIVVIVIGSILVVSAIAYCIYKNYKQRKQRNAANFNSQLIQNGQGNPSQNNQSYFNGQSIRIGGNLPTPQQGQPQQQYYPPQYPPQQQYQPSQQYQQQQN